MAAFISPPLSQRNNNPGNMRPLGSSNGFQSFSTPQDGIEAMRRDLLLKIAGNSPAMASRFGADYAPTLANLINTWAPPTENNTNNYLKFVSQKTGIDPNAVLAQADVERIMPAMIEQEGGKQALDHFTNDDEWTDEVAVDDWEDDWEDETSLEEPNLLQRIGGDLEKRAVQLGSNIDRAKTGERTIPEAAGGALASSAGLIFNDIPAEVLTSLYKSLPDQSKQSIKSDLKNFSNTLVGKNLNEIGTDVLRQYSGFKEVHPRAAENLENAATVGQAFIPVKGGTAATVVGDAAIGAGKTIGKVAGAPVKYGFKGSKNIIKGLGARTADELDRAAETIGARSSKAYQAMKAEGATFTPQSSLKIVSDVASAVSSDGILNKGLHGKTMSVLEDLVEAAKKPDFSLEEVDQWRQLLGQVAGNVTPDNLQDARKATVAIHALDEVVDQITDADLSNGTTKAIDSLDLGRNEYRKKRKFETIADVVKKSDGDANYLKRELKKIRDNPKKSRGFTPEELDALDEAATLTGGEGLLKLMGKFGFDAGKSRIGSGVGALVGSGASAAAFGPVGAVVAPVVGTAARYAQKGIARNKVENLLKIIEK